MSQLLLNKLAEVRRKHIGVSASTGVLAAVGAFVLILGIGMLLDWWLNLSWTLRAAILAVNLGAAIMLILKYAVAPAIFAPNDEEIALRVEHDQPDFRSRLISAVQLTRPGAVPAGASVSLVRAMVHQTESMSQPLDFTRVVRSDALIRIAAATTLILAGGLAGLALGGQTSGDLLKRAFLSNIPVPRKTRVIVDPSLGNRVIARGDSVTLEALARGIKPREGTVEVRFERGATQRFTMDRDPEQADRYTRQIENVQSSFTYQIFLNDGQSERFRVEAVARPQVQSIECAQLYPRYVTQADPKLNIVPRQPGDLTLLAGSRLALKVTSNKPVRLIPSAVGAAGVGNRVRLLGQDPPDSRPRFPIDFPLESDGGGDNTRLIARDGVQASIPLPAGTTGFSVYLIDEYGLETRDPAVYRVDLVPDKPPVVKVTYPDRKEELVTTQAWIAIGFDVADDYAIEKLNLHYKRDDENAGEEKTISLETGRNPKNLRGWYKWELAKMKPSLGEGAVIEWWLEAQDTNNVTGPGKSSSEHYQARVVSEADKRAELMARTGDMTTTLTDLTSSQESLNQRLGNMVLEKSRDSAP